MESAEGVISILRASLSSAVAAYLVPLMSTVSWSQPEISTEPLKVSSVIRPPAFSAWVWWKSSVKRSELPKSSQSHAVSHKSPQRRGARSQRLRIYHLLGHNTSGWVGLFHILLADSGV